MNKWIKGKGRILLRQGSAVVTCYRHPSLPGLFIARSATKPNDEKHPQRHQRHRRHHWTVTHDKTGLMVARTKSLMLLRDVQRLALDYLQEVDWEKGAGVLSGDFWARRAKTLLGIALGSGCSIDIGLEETRGKVKEKAEDKAKRRIYHEPTI